MSSSNKDADADSDEEVPELHAKEDAVEASEPAAVTDLSNPEVVTKYQEAAKIAQLTLQHVINKCIPGARIVDICRSGDDFIEQKTGAIFKNKSKSGKIVLKGIAFPVCLSVNEVVCHCSPLESDETYAVLAAEDMVKIDLGVHIDGFIAVVAHTTIVPSSQSPPPPPTAEGTSPSTLPPAPPAAEAASAVPPITGPRQAVINAAWVAAEVACKLVKAGGTNSAVTAAMKIIAEAFDVRPVSGTLMHQMKQFVVDGNKMVLLREEAEQKVESCVFEALEVYALDVAMSSGDGRPRDGGQRTTVYKRAVERKYSLRNKCSRVFFNDVNKRFPTLPFSIRAFSDEKAAKMGVRECVTHQILMPYPVLMERKGDVVGHVKFTLLLLPGGSLIVTGLPPPTLLAGSAATAESAGPSPASALVGLTLVEQSGVTLPEEIMELLRQPLRPDARKKSSKKKDSKKKAGEEEADKK